MIRTVEQRNDIMLCAYSWSGWAIFVYKPDKDGDWKCIKNGKYADVFPEYLRMIGKHA